MTSAKFYPHNGRRIKREGVRILQIIVALVLNAVALMATAYVVPGIGVANFTAALLAGIVLGVINTFIKPVLRFLTAPLSVVTLGLFAFVVDAIALFIVAAVVPGFSVDGWIAAILGAIVLAVVATVLTSVFKDVANLKLGK